VERKQGVKWSTHLKYGGLILSLIGGGTFYHVSHPLIHTINRALDTANKAVDTARIGENVNLTIRHGGCTLAEIKGPI
jgi:hypothetical protein